MKPMSSESQPFGDRAARARPGEGSSLPRHVLLNVENSDARRLLRTALFRAAGFEVIEAESAGEALVIATRHPLSVALLDVNLPDSSGVALCDTLKRLSPGLPVVLISAGGVTSDVTDAGRDVGAVGYFVEPVDPEVLVNSVRSAVNGGAPGADSQAWIVTDDRGLILQASAEGARLLSGTPRSLQQRNLIVFFEQDRDAWCASMTRASRGERVTRSGRLRPKERRPIAVRVEIKSTIDEIPPALLWTFLA